MNAQPIIERADAILITAGAGMGVDSGLPDFRGKSGLWREYPDLAEMNLDFESIANPRWFRSKPELAWAFYGHRLHKYARVSPHEGFAMLLDLCNAKGKNYFVVTSNVDNHFQKAGFDQNMIHEIHGSIVYFQCIFGCHRDIWPADYESVVVDENTFAATSVPRCPHCGQIARPNILMFDDFGWLCDRERQQRERFNRWLRRIKSEKQRLLIIEIGAGKAIPTIRIKSENLFRAMRHNADFIRINPRDVEVPAGAIAVVSGGLDGIRALTKPKCAAE